MQQLFSMVSFEGLEGLMSLSQFLVMLVDGDIKAVGAGIAAIGVVGTGFGQGLATAKAVEAVGKNPEAEKKVRSLFILGMALTESAAIYALLLGIIIAFAS